ncbi:ClpXP protease specificity-enhancing factor SspB [Vulgatibacter incomptus]|uniref:Stringent starvation protein B n=1 Tax=Vulgatibacter incomptus TaxID=1391653 RepID=A0A0K1P9G1_9BACT|nr:ClpXP protease specificity-enhancing factor SspB [Vulgatibacter incomptus]AKU89724.1 Stringent starvation protein B [Vulgatibacter incomptus]
MVMVTLDARCAGVDVPDRFQDDPRLRLNLSYRFGLALDLNEWGVRATLTFGGMPHGCKLPWGAIYQMLSHVTSEQFLFPDDVPGDLERAMKPAPSEAPSGERKGGKARPRFSVVSGNGEEGPAEAAPVSTGEPPPDDGGGGAVRRGHLRRIK